METAHLAKNQILQQAAQPCLHRQLGTAGIAPAD